MNPLREKMNKWSGNWLKPYLKSGVDNEDNLPLIEVNTHIIRRGWLQSVLRLTSLLDNIQSALTFWRKSQREPFTNEIMEAQIPPNYKGLNIDRYDGTIDSNEHIYVYKMQMSLDTSEKSVMCRVFPTSLKGGALSWFIRLPPDSAHCFKTLMS